MANNRKPGESELFKLSKQCVEDSERWFGDSGVTTSLPHHALSLCGEAGELANIIKKIDRGSLDITQANVRYQLMMETTDVFVYLLNIAGLLGLDLEKSYHHIRGQNEKRFMTERAAREEARRVNGA